MNVSANIPDALYDRLAAAGLLTDEGIARLLAASLDARDGSPLSYAYRTLFEQTQDAVFIVAPDGKNIAVNQRAAELTGYTIDELLSMSFRETAVDVPASNTTMMNLLTGRKVAPYERDFRKKSGEIFNSEVSAELVRGANGEPQYIQSVVRDITKRKRDEHRLRESERLLRQIIDNVPVHIFAKDRNSRYIIANTALAEAYGTTVENMIGKMDAEFTKSQEQADMFVAGDRRIIETGQPFILPEEDYFDAQGRHRILRTVKLPLRFPGTDEIGILGISTDITELKQAANELRQAYRQAYELAAQRQHVQILTQFIQDTSHEFRTPLSVITMSVYLLTRTADEEKRASHAEKALTNIKRITRLLEQLQTMAEVDGGIAFEFAPVNLNALIRSVVARMPRPEDKARLAVQFRLSEGIPQVSADWKQLGQALECVFENAVRFTPADGSIAVSTWQHDGKAVIEISDTGIGIPPDMIEHVTRRFWRLDEAHSTPGFGLGLPIAQTIFERHNGALSVASPAQAGTIVTMTLPLPT